MGESGKIIDLESYPICIVLEMLLKDMTTGKNILFATNSYSKINPRITEKTQMTEALIRSFGDRSVLFRVAKTIEQQSERTRKKAEVFTPAWICNKMNNHCDEEWFGRKNVFNVEKGTEWQPVLEPIVFRGTRTWEKYVDSKRLEVACGEAPYIVSRYDATTGEEIGINMRIGILDRKLRVISENTTSEKEWMKWVVRAFQSVYGYEFQGDNLLIARINLLMTFVDYLRYRWNRMPTDLELKKISNIIVWNLWQMDGITETVPFGKNSNSCQRFSRCDYTYGINNMKKEVVNCKIFDWRSNEELIYKSLCEER